MHPSGCIAICIFLLHCERIFYELEIVIPRYVMVKVWYMIGTGSNTSGIYTATFYETMI